ncbi:MAG: hypothetical protein PHR00_01210 [Patescibacteria group bacterium]|nr:hypothetical protein [Patescibacteria group bacterium]
MPRGVHKKDREEQKPKHATKRSWHGQRIKDEPHISPEELLRLEEILNQEEKHEQDLRREMQEIIRSRDKALSRELKGMEERNKRLIMWIGVTLLMTVIISFWLMNIRAATLATVNAGPKNKNFDVKGARENLSKTMVDLVDRIDNIKAEAEKLKQSTSTATTTPLKNPLP